MSYSAPYKIAMMGGGGVGKSAITLRFSKSTLNKEFIIIDLHFSSLEDFLTF